jgi:hypothetical protein
VTPLAPRRALIALLASAGLTLATVTGLPAPASAAPPPSPARIGYQPADCNATPATPDTAQCFAEIQNKPASASRLAPNAQAPAATALGPADIRAAYDLPAAGGDGQTVAVVDALGTSTVEADLAVFRAHYGLPACTTGNGCFRKVDQTGGTDYPADDKGWGEETALDVDAVSAVCPGCHILLVEGDSASLADLATATETAVRLGARFVSNSYGLSPENSVETTLDSSYDHPGVVITASTGDKPNIPIWPSTNPHVLGVGGTTLTRADGTDRGWTESAWSSGGSGCSDFEAQPQYQASLATGCPRRASADISADADPATGLAVYDTLQLDGWQQIGGTSLSSPLVAAMYALAGSPVAGTYPVEYPYDNGSAGLNDVTAGSNGTCGTVLCNAGPGWDGPTGLGTPNGLGALRLGPHGTITGTVSSGGTAVPGVALTLRDTAAGRTFRATSGADGRYSLTVAAGTYDVTTSMFGYAASTRTGIAVADGATVTTDLALTRTPTRTVSGTVTDGSGHGYPLAATVTIDGYPGGAIHTDPFTGAYSVALPESATYSMHATATYPGYQTVDTSVAVGTRNQRQDVAVTADTDACGTPGYAYPLGTDFETAPPTGWTVTDHATTGLAWQFDDTQANLTGGTGNYAAADPFDNNGTAVDADLTSPAADLTGQPGTLNFDALVIGTGVDASADVSIDGGATWTAAWTYDNDNPIGGFEDHVNVAIPQAAGRKQVEVRFHFAGSGQTIMEVDNVHLGQCVPVAGGLVAGQIKDGNTGRAITSATVTDRADPAIAGGTDGTGFYWFFSRPAGRHGYTVSAPRYADAVSTARTVADAVVRQDVSLKAGQLVVSPGALRATGTVDGSVSRRLTLTNTGHQEMHVSFLTQGSSAAPSSASSGAPVVITGGEAPDTSHGAVRDHLSTVPAITGSAWRDLSNLPQAVQDNASGYYRGKTYSVGGVTDFFGGSILAGGNVYDPATGAWTPIADMPEPLDSSAAAFVDGTMYVVGGWGTDFKERSTTYAYHPLTNSWTRVADLPAATAAAAVATLDGKLYIVGGCEPGCSTSSNAVYRYDPATDKWTRLADYPHIARWGACAGASGRIVCSGGVWDDPHAESLAGTYLFDPATGKWTAGADSPEATFGAIYGGADGMLQIVGGSVPGGMTNRALRYDPVADVWSDLPAANSTIMRGAGGCGMTRVGGWPSTFGPPTASAEELPGLDGCEGDDVAWLTVSKPSVDLPPGRSATVTVRLDGAAAGGTGLHAATLFAVTDAPYDSGRVAVSYQVNPPRTAGTITGTVTDASNHKPVAGATVKVCAGNGHGCEAGYTARTDGNGHYTVKVTPGLRVATLTFSAHGYRTGSTTVRLGPAATTANIALRRS